MNIFRVESESMFKVRKLNFPSTAVHDLQFYDFIINFLQLNKVKDPNVLLNVLS